MALWLSQVAAQAALLFTISGISVQFSSAVNANAEQCKIEKRDNAYVTALYEHYPAMSGCISREQTSTMQEIHAVIIRSMTATSLRTSERTPSFKNGVDVIVKHDSQRTVGHANAVFVLVSAQPTTWRIHSEKSFNGSLGLFHVSRHSEIKREGRTKLRMRKANMPTDPQQLANWIRKNWTALTTLMVTEIASVITLKVGIDPSAKEKCEIDPYLPNVFASHVEVQETRGCLAPLNEGRGDKDLHIIELMSPSVDYVNSTRYDVRLNVRSKTRPVISRHVVLVLKSHVPVHWHVVTHSMRGTLDIFTDQAVDSNGTNTHSCRVAMENLTAYYGSNLVSWASDEKYGLLVSYTEAQIANQFDLIVDDRDRLDSGRSRESSEIQVRDVIVLPNDFEGRQNKRNHHDARADENLNLKLMIIKALLISCEDDNINLTIQKRALRYQGMLPSRVSFSDESCAATDNGTHFILSTGKHLCGTAVIPSRDAIAYRNAIVVQWGLRSSIRINRHNTSVSSSGGSEVNPSDSISLMINISCDSPLTTDAAESGLPTVSSDIQFQLKLFRDALFRNEILSFPARISNEEMVYVQADIRADDCMRVNVNSCLLEFDRYTEERLLIVNGCSFDTSVRWVNTDSEYGGKSQRFEFRFQQVFNISAMLQCKLTVCAVCPNPIVPGVPQCKVRKPPCGHPDSSSQMAGIVASISKGPLELLVPSTGTLLGTDHTTSSSVLSSVNLKTAEDLDLGGGYGRGGWEKEETGAEDGRHKCEQKIRVEGLSTEIVVSIAFTAFIIGILLMASLWCIYVRTGPAKMKAKPGIRSVSNSGDSTPSSTAPMTVHPTNAHRR